MLEYVRARVGECVRACLMVSGGAMLAGVIIDLVRGLFRLNRVFVTGADEVNQWISEG